MNKDQRVYPFDDEVMTYDYNAHRYVLTEKGVFDELGEDLDSILNASGDANPSTLPARFLNRVSQTVYRYLYRDTQSEQWLEYILAKYPPLRDTVKEMLQAQLMYMLASGDISLYSGVNFARGQIMDVNALRDRAAISPDVEHIANEAVAGLGYSLKYVGGLPYVPCEAYRRGY